MINYKNCRWLYPSCIDEKDLCLNSAIDEEIVNDVICGECSHFYSYIESDNINIIDEDTESLI